MLGIRARVAEWKAQSNPLSYGGTPELIIFTLFNLSMQSI